MELEKNKNIQKKVNENRNDYIQSKYTNSNTDPKDEMYYQNSNTNTFINSLNINEIRNYMDNNNIINENDPLLTEIYKNNVSSKGNESLGSINYDLVMNQNYNYNPKASSNNSSQKNAEINSPNYLYTSSKEYNNKNHGNNNDYQYYSEQKSFNPKNILFNNSTKKSTRSTGTKGEFQENNIQIDTNENINNINNDNNSINAINNYGRSSLTKMINECYESNDNDLEDDNVLNSNRKDNKMTMNSFDSSQKNYRTNNNSQENENTLDEDGEEEELNNVSNSNINSLNEKSMNSEKMNFNNEEMCYLLNGNKQNIEYQESQISDYNIHSKGKKDQIQTNVKERNAINNNNINNKNKDINANIKKDMNKNQKLPQQKSNNNTKNNLNESNPYEIGNKINKNQFGVKIPFQGNYFEYKKYEKYILDNEELLNNGNEEDAFGNYVDNIIKKSYHVYTNRQCSTCAKLLTKGKSCIHCPKYHHTLKTQRNQKIKSNVK